MTEQFEAWRKRRAAIWEMRQKGHKIKDIAKVYGISPTRVGELIRKEDRIRKRHGSAATISTR